MVAGPGDEIKDAASVRADYPVPADLALYYFEVTVVNKCRHGCIGLRLAALAYQSMSCGQPSDERRPSTLPQSEACCTGLPEHELVPAVCMKNTRPAVKVEACYTCSPEHMLVSALCREDIKHSATV